MRNWNFNFHSLRHTHARFYLTYEELKPPLQPNCSQNAFKILSYLWGIETNMVERQSLMMLYRILSYLWGIETPPAITSLDKTLADFILPMRNWNYAECTCKYWYNCDFILPMRNWNSFLIIFNTAITVGFYLTYEELKLLQTEERHRKNNKGFYLTYEELKLFWKRNINKVWKRILSYLWGIETWNKRGNFS